jgi:hypothetical protein
VHVIWDDPLLPHISTYTSPGYISQDDEDAAVEPKAAGGGLFGVSRKYS